MNQDQRYPFEHRVGHHPGVGSKLVDDPLVELVHVNVAHALTIGRRVSRNCRVEDELNALRQRRGCSRNCQSCQIGHSEGPAGIVTDRRLGEPYPTTTDDAVTQSEIRRSRRLDVRLESHGDTERVNDENAPKEVPFS